MTSVLLVSMAGMLRDLAVTDGDHEPVLTQERGGIGQRQPQAPVQAGVPREAPGRPGTDQGTRFRRHHARQIRCRAEQFRTTRQIHWPVRSRLQYRIQRFDPTGDEAEPRARMKAHGGQLGPHIEVRALSHKVSDHHVRHSPHDRPTSRPGRQGANEREGPCRQPTDTAIGVIFREPQPAVGVVGG